MIPRSAGRSCESWRCPGAGTVAGRLAPDVLHSAPFSRAWKNRFQKSFPIGICLLQLRGASAELRRSALRSQHPSLFRLCWQYRLVWMPPGTSAQYREDAAFEFPIGDDIRKDFCLPSRWPRSGKTHRNAASCACQVRMEAVCLHLDDAQTEAALETVPDPVKIKFTSESGKLRDFILRVHPTPTNATSATTTRKCCSPSVRRRGFSIRTFTYASGSETS